MCKEVRSTVQFSSVAQSCPTLCNPMDCNMPGLPVYHQFPEFTQTHVHWLGDSIKLSHPLFSPSPPAFNLSQHQVFSNESVLRIRWPKYWRFSFSISPSNEYSALISFRMDRLDLLAVQGTLKSLLQHHSSKASILQCSGNSSRERSGNSSGDGLWRRLSTEELMLLNCGVGEDSWESLGLQGDPTSPF